MMHSINDLVKRIAWIKEYKQKGRSMIWFDKWPNELSVKQIGNGSSSYNAINSTLVGYECEIYIGENVSIGTSLQLIWKYGGHDFKGISLHPMFAQNRPIPPSKLIIGDNALIGSFVTILVDEGKTTTIGHDTEIIDSSLVNKSIEANQKYIGVPVMEFDEAVNSPADKDMPIDEMMTWL